jgi:hypothetical protein
MQFYGEPDQPSRIIEHKLSTSVMSMDFFDALQREGACR